MPYLDKVIDLINTRLSTGTLARPAFQMGKYFGLAKQVNVINTSTNTVRPMIYGQDGSEIDPFVDDKYPFIIYHRPINVAYGFPQGFGDGSDLVGERISMTAVIFGDFETLGIDQNQLAFLIAAGIAGPFNSSDTYPTGISSCKVTPVTANLDSSSVLRQEYGIVDYTLDPKDSFFSLNYNIEMNADKNCIPCVEC